VCRIRPTDITKAVIRVFQTNQCPVLVAMRMERTDNLSSPLAEVRKLTIRQVSESSSRSNDRCVEAMIGWLWPTAAFGDRFRIADRRRISSYPLAAFRKTENRRTRPGADTLEQRKKTLSILKIPGV